MTSMNWTKSHSLLGLYLSPVVSLIPTDKNSMSLSEMRPVSSIMYIVYIVQFGAKN